MIDDSVPTNSNNKIWLALGGCMTLFVCICCICFAAVGAAIYASEEGWLDSPTPSAAAGGVVIPTPTLPAQLNMATAAAITSDPAAVSTPTVVETAVSPDPSTSDLPLLTHLNIPKTIEQSPIPAIGMRDLEALYDADYPEHDYYETAVRLGNLGGGNRTMSKPSYTVGDTQTFTADGEQIQANLIYATEHIYFWMEDGLNLNKAEISAAADRLENTYYPQLTALFGQEWSPGIDGDPRFSIVHIAGDNNSDELGWFIDSNEYPTSIFNESNEQEMIYLVMNNLDTDEPLYDGTLVHEVQHLIQWKVDSNETSWMNEGLSQLAEIYMGLNTVDSYDYLIAPETQLNTWSNDETVDAHYASAYLYALYIWEQLGDGGVQALSRQSANGLAGVRKVLADIAPERSLEQFTADWAAANYLDDPAGGKYGYRAIDIDDPAIEQRLGKGAFDEVNELAPFGVHYVALNLDGGETVRFAGDTVVPLIDNPPLQGNMIWFAPSVDNTDAVLQRPFDLTGLNRATLTFDAWYDLEEDWDYVYLSISQDGGASWELLVPQQATAGSFGPGWNGRSDSESSALKNGWVKEEVSLNNYVGNEVILRFDLLTDSAINGRGFAVDNFAIPELGYTDEVEMGLSGLLTDGWKASGFVQTGWLLPQLWSVQWVHDGIVEQLPLNELNQGEWVLGEENGRYTDSVLIIMPQTPYVDQAANYWLQKE